MSETTETNAPNDTESTPITETERAHTALNRVLNISIFFVGVGAYAVAGLGLHEIGLFEGFQLTFFAVGVVVGAVGLLLWFVTR